MYLSTQLQTWVRGVLNLILLRLASLTEVAMAATPFSRCMDDPHSMGLCAETSNLTLNSTVCWRITAECRVLLEECNGSLRGDVLCRQSSSFSKLNLKPTTKEERDTQLGSCRDVPH